MSTRKIYFPCAGLLLIHPTIKIVGLLKRTSYKHGETGVKLTETSREEQMEALREYYCENHVL